MAVISFTNFVGANSDISDKLLPENFAVEATNVFTDQGALSTWKGLKAVTGTWNSKTGTLKSLFLLNNALWLAWATNKVDAALVQKESNLDWELAFTGTDKPRYTSKLLAISGGGTAYPEVSYPLGIIAPTAALVTTVVAKSSPAGSVKISWQIAGTVDDTVGNRIARSYVYTYVNASGREGPPSPVSNIAYSNDDELVRLTGLPTAPQADITKIRVYVSATGGTFNFLKEITLPATTNDITDNTFGSAITTTLYSPPPDTLVGLAAMANGILVGYSGNNLYFSEPYQSHAWPEDYIKPMDYPIKGVSAIGNMSFVSTEGSPVVVVGNHPSFMTFNKLGAIQANVSDRSMVDMGNGAMYASRDGIVLLAGGKASMVSDGIISERVYQLMAPSSIHAYFYRDKYFGFYDSGSAGTLATATGEYIPAKGAFILDPKRGAVTFTDVTCDTAFSDKVTGKLYLARLESGVNKLYEWNEGTTNLVQAWRSKPVETVPMNLACARVWADRYPLTLELYADNELVHTEYVLSEDAFRLPSGFRARKWVARVTGDTHVNGIFLANSAAELRQ
ncbi:MAG: hypothetical protein Q8L15_18525 [Methylobacter sp.]|nr:hypothetical protein [Methylobacter sp.]